MKSINPFSGELIQTYPVDSDSVIEQKLENSHEFFNLWKTSTLKERSNYLKSLAHKIDEQTESLARLISSEMGKPISQSRAELKKCGVLCKYYAEEGPGFLRSQELSSKFSKARLIYEPLGPILAIMPWNFPFWQVFRFAVPALMAGNTVLLKHASNVTGCALEIAQLFQAAGVDSHFFQTLFISSEHVPKLISDSRIRGVTLTGSETAGRAVGKCAGEALKKVVLELGGSDPYCVCEDADLELAIEKCVSGRMLNNGQSCIAAKRFLVHQKRYDDFLSGMKTKMSAYQTGDPLLEQTELGPLAKTEFKESIHKQVQKSCSQGAKILLGGHEREKENGDAFYPATLLAGVGPGMETFDEEVFGPVASVVSFKAESEMIQLANSTRFGLGAAIFSRDKERALELAEKSVIAGNVFINDFVKSDPALPFGGTKDSGIGRELFSHGMHEFMNLKTVVEG